MQGFTYIVQFAAEWFEYSVTHLDFRDMHKVQTKKDITARLGVGIGFRFLASPTLLNFWLFSFDQGAQRILAKCK